MRILELHLARFGPFTDRVLELAEPGSPGLVVIHGRNEAGKSSALRAIQNLLYGIPTRSPDDFVHRYADLRIGARLLFSDGEELSVMRRKGKKNTLRSLDDRGVVDSTRFARLIESVPESHFENFYGLDHRRLVEGSEALLADDGELGRALFGAGLGSADFRNVLASLEAEAAALFAPRATTLPVNRGIKEWEELAQQVRESALRPADWEDREKALRANEERLARLEGEIEGLRLRLARLRRIKGALPALARRNRCLEQLRAMPAVTPLRPDFETRLRAARVARDQAQLLAERARKTIEREGTRREELSRGPDPQVGAESVERLHAGLGGYLDATSDLPRRLQELERLDREIAAALEAMQAEATPAQIESFRRGQAAASRIRKLASDSDRRRGAIDQLEHDLSEARRERERLVALEREGKEEAGGPIEFTALARAEARALKLGDLDERIDQQQRAVEDLRQTAARERERLGLHDFDFERIARLAVPASAELEASRARAEAHAARRARNEEALTRIHAERLEVEERLARRDYAGAVASEASLEVARGERDDLWRRIRRVWSGEVDPLPPSGAEAVGEGTGREDREGLANRFEERMAEADRLAERLRLDADRVAQQSADRARLEALTTSFEQEQEARSVLDQERADLIKDWEQRWSALGLEAPRSEAAAAWRRDFENLTATIERLRDAQSALDRSERLRDEMIAALEVELERVGDRPLAESSAQRLDARLARVADRLAILREDAEASRQRAVDLASAREVERRLESEHARLTSEQARWRVDWQEAVQGLALAEDPPTHEAVERLASIDWLLAALASREETAARVDGMRKRTERFRAAALDLFRSAGPPGAAGQVDPSGFDPEATVLQAHAELQASRRSEAVREKIEETLAEAREELERAELAQAGSARTFAALLSEAGVASEEELDGALDAWNQFHACERRRDEAEDELASVSEGVPIPDLEAESRGIDPDALAAELAGIESVFEEKMRQRDELRVLVHSEREAQKAAFGGNRSSELSEAAEAKLAEVRRDASRYVELRLAHAILEREIEDYRIANQGPVLERASEVFCELTLGAYPSLQSEVDESGRAHLVAIRAALQAEGKGGEDDPLALAAHVPVDGLSSGTRDQLFLALRLASLEVSLGRTESMPLIADDILVEFDEERSRAGLEALARLAEKNQILLFTHHAYLADQARELGARVRVDEL